MPKIEAPQEIQSKNKLFPHWNNTFDKFNIFELFDKPNMSGVVAGKSFPGNKYWKELNSGVMVVEPEKGIKKEIIDKMIEMGQKKVTLKRTHKKQEEKRFFSNISIIKLKDKICKRFQRIGDQDVLEEFFDWKNKPELHLGEEFNVFAYYSDYYKNKLGMNPKCYHFIGSKKPWSLTPKESEKFAKSKSKV